MFSKRYTRAEFLRLSALTLVVALFLSFSSTEQVKAQTIGQHICSVGRRYLGVPYVLGGTSLKTGLDCDAYVKKVMRKCGIWVPWGMSAQAHGGRHRHGSPHPGDVVAFNEHGRGISHVAIYSGNGNILHASRYYGDVVESPMRYIHGHCATRVYR